MPDIDFSTDRPKMKRIFLGRRRERIQKTEDRRQNSEFRIQNIEPRSPTSNPNAERRTANRLQAREDGASNPINPEPCP